MAISRSSDNGLGIKFRSTSYPEIAPTRPKMEDRIRSSDRKTPYKILSKKSTPSEPGDSGIYYDY